MVNENKDLYSQMLNKIDELNKTDKPSIIAIDGMCGSGKSYLADLLASRYESNVFHMDDYFLPLDMRTESRLTEPGGNVHYERFKEEVLDPLSLHKDVIYKPYICGLWKYDEPRKVEIKKLNIVEGSYSMHPYLNKAYDLSIFLEVDESEQHSRISQRKEKNDVQQFIDKWIPMEKQYFNYYNIPSLCDIILDTSVI
ncbi:MAG: uridine kinase [Clostridiales bacterium]|nr:uridine kinase [Clostridiales bacterium]